MREAVGDVIERPYSTSRDRSGEFPGREGWRNTSIARDLDAISGVDARHARVGVVDDAVGSGPGFCSGEVKPLPAHISVHRRMIRIRVRSVAKVHSPRGLLEGRIEEDRIVPSFGEFVSMQEESFDKDYRSIGCMQVRVAVPPLSVPSAPARPQRIENMSFERVVVVAVAPEAFR